jgi:hypothetical protein
MEGLVGHRALIILGLFEEQVWCARKKRRRGKLGSGRREEPYISKRLRD